MTLAVNRAVKPQHKQTNKYFSRINTVLLVWLISVLWPFNTFYVISGAVSYPNHTVPGQASYAIYQYLVHILSPVTDNCSSWKFKILYSNRKCAEWVEISGCKMDLTCSVWYGLVVNVQKDVYFSLSLTLCTIF